MTSEVVIICPQLGRGRGGLADYTLRVVEQWKNRARLRFIIPASSGSQNVSDLGYPVEMVERNRAALLQKLPPRDGKVLLQYSAYGFDHFGYPRWLLQALQDWKAATGGLLVIMFHEIWTFWPMLNKNYLIQWLHRYELRKLVAHADALFTSTASQAEHLRKLKPRAEVQILPVGSNITPAAVLALRQPGRAVLFGLQGVRLRALRTMRGDLRALASAGRLTKLIMIGGGNSAEGDREERAIASALPFAEGAEQLGALPEEEISAQLSLASFGVSAQDELSITKSGTFMAYAAHGLNIVSPLGEKAQSEPSCWLTSPAELLRGLSVDDVDSRAAKLHAWQERAASWPAIAKRFAEALHVEKN